MTNPGGNAGETSPSEPGTGPSEPSSSGYEAPPIEQSQDRPQGGETQPLYEAGPAYPPVNYPADYPPPPPGWAPQPPAGPPPYGAPPTPDPLAPLDYPAGAGLPPPAFPPPTPPGYPQPGAGFPPPNYPPNPGYPGYGYQTDPYDPYGQPRPMGTNGMAIASLACSVAGLICCLPAVVGLILGFMGMRETRRTGQDGYGLALAGTIIGGIVTAGTVLYVLVLLVMAAVGST
ncbi:MULTISPECIES: DUF4190 domain-containing protein [Mycolicibacterium]|uniref:DUF4190 domain-containing protein n=1 Tax=Mycolicibacterium TaxID=1866885 RepID=UPI000A14B8A7|nr:MULTISPECIES: DUF4190 domain-containing protein [Mycolicibacterium]